MHHLRGPHALSAAQVEPQPTPTQPAGLHVTYPRDRRAALAKNGKASEEEVVVLRAGSPSHEGGGEGERGGNGEPPHGEHRAEHGRHREEVIEVLETRSLLQHHSVGGRRSPSSLGEH